MNFCPARLVSFLEGSDPWTYSIVKQAEGGARAASGEHVRCDRTFESVEPHPTAPYSRETTSFWPQYRTRFVHVTHFEYTYFDSRATIFDQSLVRLGCSAHPLPGSFE